MPDDVLSFGRRIANQRKELGLSLQEVADQVKKEDGETISPQYLNDIEHDRRQPDSNHLIQQLASALKLPPEVLYYEAGRGLHTDSRVSEEKIVAAYKAFRRELKGLGKSSTCPIALANSPSARTTNQLN